MRPCADGPRRSLLALLVALMAAAGCSELTEPSTGYRDPLLYEHNGQFFGGRTFRWIPPVPVFVVTADPTINAVMREQLDAWEATLAGAGGSPLFAPQPVPRHAPSRGIFFTIGDLEGAALGQGDPFVEDAIRAGGHPTPLAQRLRLLAVPRPARRAGIPQVLASGEIQTCEITIDPIVTAEDDFVIRVVVRHELGHCLGFLGHVSRGLMKASCCSLDMTRDGSGSCSACIVCHRTRPSRPSAGPINFAWRRPSISAGPRTSRPLGSSAALNVCGTRLGPPTRLPS